MTDTKVFPTYGLELNWKRTYQLIAGVDEAGVGPLAGPVVAAAVVLDSARVGFRRSKRAWWYEIIDSKKLTHDKRERLSASILKNSLSFGIGSASVEEIDEMNILQARLMAMKRAVENLRTVPEMILIDGTYVIPGISLKQEAIVRGDEKILSVACASILAKVTRDNLLLKLHEQFPQYGFDQHKGYPTKFHREKLVTHGPCAAHRKTFAPVAALLRE